MGSDPFAARCGRGIILSQLAQVVPDLPTFAVDDGFTYRVPTGMDLEVGSVVRIPLGGRRVRGFVVGLRAERPGTRSPRLKDVAGRSGDRPVFDEQMLETLRWAAVHYVGPMATVLGRSAPPNVPRRVRAPSLDPISGPFDSGLSEVSAVAAAGQHRRLTACRDRDESVTRTGRR